MLSKVSSHGGREGVTCRAEAWLKVVFVWEGHVVEIVLLQVLKFTLSAVRAPYGFPLRQKPACMASKVSLQEQGREGHGDRPGDEGGRAWG